MVDDFTQCDEKMFRMTCSENTLNGEEKIKTVSVNFNNYLKYFT